MWGIRQRKLTLGLLPFFVFSVAHRHPTQMRLGEEPKLGITAGK